MITIRNDFTANQTHIRAKAGDYLSPARCRRIKARLQASDCTSGGVLGQRGPQSFAFEPCEDGGVIITKAQ